MVNSNENGKKNYSVHSINLLFGFWEIFFVKKLECECWFYIVIYIYYTYAYIPIATLTHNGFYIIKLIIMSNATNYNTKY